MGAGSTGVMLGVVVVLSSLFLAWGFIICWFLCAKGAV